MKVDTDHSTQTLCISRRSPEEDLARIEKCTRAILFMGTPQCGAEAADLGDMAVHPISVFRPANSSIVTLLRPDSEVLARVRTGFHELLKCGSRQGTTDSR